MLQHRERLRDANYAATHSLRKPEKPPPKARYHGLDGSRLSLNSKALQVLSTGPAGGTRYWRAMSRPVIPTSSLLKTTSVPKAVPVQRWHQVQWQIVMRDGSAVVLNRTAPHTHPPVRSSIAVFASAISSS
jgi:hypothetical protein